MSRSGLVCALIVAVAWARGLFGGLIGGTISAARAGDRWEQVWP